MGLAYGDWDALEELTKQQAPDEVVDFILSFSGISRDQAKIGYAIILYTPRLPEGYIISGICPVWGDEIYTENHIDSRMSHIFRMGQMDNIVGAGPGTMGHPLNAAGRSYITSVHGLPVLGNDVFVTQSTGRIGIVLRVINNASVDIAEVGLNISNSQMSANLPNSWNWPAGASIANFRGTAGLNNEVRSIRGRSGVHQSRVTALNATVGTRTNQLLTYPNGNSLAGDSGSALIRVSDSAVLGTRSGTAIISGRTYGRYTHVQRY